MRPRYLPLLLAALVYAPPTVLAQPPIAAPASADVSPLSLAQLEELAIRNNPTLRQAEAEVDAARARRRQAGLLPNPTVGYTAEEVALGPTFRGGEHGVFIDQAIPLGGKLRLSRAIFDREITQAEALRDLQRQRILTGVRVLFYETLALERRVAVRERLAQLSAEAVTISRQLYNVGAADRTDVLESEVEAKRADLELLAARNQRFTRWRQLATAAGDTTLTPRPLAASLEEAIPEIDRAGALQMLLERSPEAQAARAAFERSRAIVARARRESFPDLFVRAGALYNRELLERTPQDVRRAVGWEAQVEAGLSIPLFNRNQGGVAAARADQARAESELRRIALSLESRLAAVFEEYLTALRSSEVYRSDIIPRAEEAYRLYLARYREMAAAYPQVLIAQRTLFQMNEEYLSAVEGTWRAGLQLQGFLLTDALDAPGRPGEVEIGGNGSGVEFSVPGTMRSSRPR